MLSAKKRKALQEAAEAWVEAAGAAALQIEFGIGKAVERAEQEEKNARKAFEDILNQA